MVWFRRTGHVARVSEVRRIELVNLRVFVYKELKYKLHTRNASYLASNIQISLACVDF